MHERIEPHVYAQVAADQAGAKAKAAKKKAGENAEEIHALKLEVQELRQAVLFLLNPFSNKGIALNDSAAEHHYEKLGNHQRVE